MPDEIVIVDGGSADGTLALLAEMAAARHAVLRIVEAPGANIARGRNLATEAASHDIIACTDAGCRAAADWLERLIAPFEVDPETEFVAGFYRVDGHTLLEEVIGLATMRGQLAPIDPETFNPSGRSMAYRKDIWRRAGGWPEWLRFSEDTLFDLKLRRMRVGWRVAADALVYWRPRRNLRALARQFYFYGTGRGHTRIDAPSFHYNLRNLILVLFAAGSCFLTVWGLPLMGAMFGYFFLWGLHPRAAAVARHTRRFVAYPLALVVLWTVQIAGTVGYLVGAWQRLHDKEKLQEGVANYMRGGCVDVSLSNSAA
jgi:glycosyltransferase involved in cell wall biosynthesis